MLSRVEQVWRHIVDGAQRGRRRWSSVTELAAELDLPNSTVHQSLEEPRSIGAVDVLGAGGLRVIDPGGVLVLWAAKRRLAADIEERVLVPVRAATVEASVLSGEGVLGGCSAVVAHRGFNGIAAYSSVLVYGEPSLPDFGDEGATCEVVFARPDDRLGRYGQFTTLGQAWVDLFRTPGWEASRFVHDLLSDVLAEDQRVLLRA